VSTSKRDQGSEAEHPKAVRLLSWRSVLLFWLGYSAFVSLPALVSSPLFEQETSFVSTWSSYLLFGALWALATPLILTLARRLFISGPRRWVNLVLHLIACGVISVLQLTVFTELFRLLHATSRIGPFHEHLVSVINIFFSAGVMYYWFAVLAFHALTNLDRVRQTELSAARIAAQLNNARLEAIRAKLNPHFLFNALHTVGSLVRLNRPEAAQETLSELSSLLRQSLDGSGQPLVPLAEELELAKKYLAIEQRRFADRLRVTYDIESGTQRALVPVLLLQPLLENAVRHGVSKSPNAGTIEIRARRRGDKLELEVHDDGPGLPDGFSSKRLGIGLGSTRARLKQLYLSASKLTLVNRPERGVIATVSLPFCAPAEEATA